jgi:hypothetical protein
MTVSLHARPAVGLIKWAPLLLIWPAVDVYRLQHSGRSPFNPPRRVPDGRKRAPGRSRTYDLSLRRRLLYPLSYWGIAVVRRPPTRAQG